MKKENNQLEKETYTTPDFEVVQIEMEQNILLAGSSGDLPTMDNEDW